MHNNIMPFIDNKTNSVSYILFDKQTKRATLIDPILHYDIATGWTATDFADNLILFLKDNNLTLDWILETQIHTEHLTAAYYIKNKIGGKIAISHQILHVQHFFKTFFNLYDEFPTDGSQFDHLLLDGETLNVGNLNVAAIAVPGHTPAGMAYLVNDCAFIGNTLLMPDIGTPRCDFPGGNAGQLFDSIKYLFTLPDETQLYLSRNFPSQKRDYSFTSSIKEQKKYNIDLNNITDKDNFIAKKMRQDDKLTAPPILLPAVQINMRAGAFPKAERNGVNYIKIPLNYY